MNPQQKPGFINRNLVSIVMIPGIILMHWGWLKLQDTPPAKVGYSAKDLEEKPQLPITKIYNKVRGDLFETVRKWTE